MVADVLTFEIFTLFPEAITAFLRAGLIGRALEEGRVAVHCTNPRDYARDRHRTVDDSPYGGGPGMLLKVEPLVDALTAVEVARGPVHRVLLTPSAPRFDQRAAERLATRPRIALFCGRYEGIDDRLREHYIDECLSLGDFILNGGEVAALVVVEAVARLFAGVVGNTESLARESFSSGVVEGAAGSGLWLEPPQYTRPAEFRGHRVPEVLVRGHHGDIDRWRQHTAWARTWHERPRLRRAQRASAPRLRRPIYVALSLSPECSAQDGGTELERASFQRALLERLHAAGAAGLLLFGDASITWWRRDKVARSSSDLRVENAATIQKLRRLVRRRHGARPVSVDVQAISFARGEIATVGPDDVPETRDPVALEDLLSLRERTEAQREESREVRHPALILHISLSNSSKNVDSAALGALRADIRYRVALGEGRERGSQPGRPAETTPVDLTDHGVARTLKINEPAQPLFGYRATLELASAVLSSLSDPSSRNSP
jgi:tRNA (guanine37-N1)-methyltransferase